MWCSCGLAQSPATETKGDEITKHSDQEHDFAIVRTT